MLQLSAFSESISFAKTAPSPAPLAAAAAVPVNGGPGSDTFLGLAGDDGYFGLAGEDFIFGGAGNDQLYGGADNDFLEGGTGTNLISGDAGIDTASYASSLASGVVVRLDLGTATGVGISDQLSGIENVFGGKGNDRIVGDGLDNLLAGAKGNDLLFGGAGNDLLLGGRGVDRLFGDSADDGLYGGNGADFIIGGKGSDVLFGGAGADQFVFGILGDLGGSDDIMDFEVGLDKLVIGQLPGGDPANLPSFVFNPQSNGSTLVQVNYQSATLFEITVQSLNGTISQSDIVFSFNG